MRGSTLLTSTFGMSSPAFTRHIYGTVGKANDVLNMSTILMVHPCLSIAIELSFVLISIRELPPSNLGGPYL